MFLQNVCVIFSISFFCLFHIPMLFLYCEAPLPQLFPFLCPSLCLLCLLMACFSHLFLLSFFLFSLSGCFSAMVCFRAEGSERHASCLPQCSFLPASVCWSSGPHCPAQRARWGAGKRQSLFKPLQDWISGYTCACAHIWELTH